MLVFLKDYIVFAEKDDELKKYIPRQHQTGAVEATVTRALDPKRAIELIKKREPGERTRVINLIKNIEKPAQEASDDPDLIAMAERAHLGEYEAHLGESKKSTKQGAAADRLTHAAELSRSPGNPL